MVVRQFWIYKGNRRWGEEAQYDFLMT